MTLIYAKRESILEDTLKKTGELLSTSFHFTKQATALIATRPSIVGKTFLKTRR